MATEKRRTRTLGVTSYYYSGLIFYYSYTNVYYTISLLYECTYHYFDYGYDDDGAVLPFSFHFGVKEEIGSPFWIVKQNFGIGEYIKSNKCGCRFFFF